MARLVARQQGVYVDIERKQVTNRIAVFGSVQPPEGIGSAGIGVSGGRAVKRGLKRLYDGVVGGLIRARYPWGRHPPRAKPADHFLPYLRVTASVFAADDVESEPRRCCRAIVAADAVLADESALGGVRRWRGGYADGAGGHEQDQSPAACPPSRAAHETTSPDIISGSPFAEGAPTRLVSTEALFSSP